MKGNESRFEARSDATSFRIAERVTFGRNVVFGPRCKDVEIGYGCFIGNDVYIDVEHLRIGDYTTIHHGGVFHGVRTSVGHNCWLGHYTIVDSLGGDTRIGNNVGIGAHSQLWSHMKFGDVLNGCRWNSSGRLYLDDDVWLVGHSIVGPIHAHSRAMLMTGGVSMKDMEANHVYAGSPAKDMTDKFGPQFEERPLPERVRMFEDLVDEFCRLEGVGKACFEVVDAIDRSVTDRTQFNVRERTYWPIRSDAEYRFMRFMLYEKAKWLPAD